MKDKKNTTVSAKKKIKNGIREKINSKLNVWGLIISLLGVILVLLSIISEEIRLPHFLDEYQALPHITAIIQKFVEHFGVALIILGLVSIITDFDDWRIYFQKRLAETIVQRDYLKTLEETELLNLQTDTLKAFFDVDDIDRNGSFLEHFHEKIRDYIGSHYREDTDIMTNVNFAGDSKDLLTIEETISYKCRKVGKFIQSNIQWFYEVDDVKDLIDYSVQIEMPRNFFQSPEFQTPYPNVTDQQIIFKKDDADLKKLGGKKLGFILSLDKYKEIDGLKIKIDATYIIEKSKYMTWKMTQPSNRIKLLFTFPEELEVSMVAFGISKDEAEVQDKKDFHSIKYDSWMLPYSGFAFQFNTKKDISKAIVPANSESAETIVASNQETLPKDDN